jgi:glycosyltransferase involved in cell wall biosynthesis
VEAMSRGCPALGSKTGGIPELLNKDFIFQKGAVDEICALLERLDKETMYEEAIRSFEKAKEFDRDLLERRRTAFYKLFTRQSI